MITLASNAYQTDERAMTIGMGETSAHDSSPLDGGESGESDSWLQPVADLRIVCPVLP